jgi:hypothetical protein
MASKTRWPSASAMTDAPKPRSDAQPTDRDRENAHLRPEIAFRQAQEYDQVQSWAEAAFDRFL